MNLPPFRSEQTGNAQLDRIQNMVRTVLEYLRGLLWLERNAFAALRTDISTASATYADILTASIVTVSARSFLNILFTASGAHVTNNGTTFFQILVDGAVVKGTEVTATANTVWSAAFVDLAPVTAGKHLVTVQWKTNAASARINAASLVEEHAAISVHEEVAA